MNTLLKFIIAVVMVAIIPVTAVIYFGATNPTGKISILTIGILLYLLLGFYHSWISIVPRSFREWLKN